MRDWTHTDDNKAARVCGGCTVCCAVLAVDDPELKKDAWSPCQHCDDGSGCTVWNVRPETCRRYECEWRRDQDGRVFSDELRPDRSGIMVTHFTVLAQQYGLPPDREGTDGWWIVETKPGALEKAQADWLNDWQKHIFMVVFRSGERKGEVIDRVTQPTRVGGGVLRWL